MSRASNPVVKAERYGAPVKYNGKVLKEFARYLKQCDKINNSNAKNKKVKLPTITGFANHLNIRRETLYAWEGAKDESNKLFYPEVANIMCILRQKGEETLVNNGLAGKFNSSMSKFTLQNLHDWTDKSEVNSHSTLDVRIASITADVPPELASQAYKQLINR